MGLLDTVKKSKKLIAHCLFALNTFSYMPSGGVYYFCKSVKSGTRR